MNFTKINNPLSGEIFSGESLLGTVGSSIGMQVGQGIGGSKGSTIGGALSSTLDSFGDEITENLLNKDKMFKGLGRSFGLSKAARLKNSTDAMEWAKGLGASKNAIKAAGTFGKMASGFNLAGMASSIGSEFLDEKTEYSGKRGNLAKGLDTGYDTLATAVNFIPGIGQGISGLMAVNKFLGKGINNLGGGTDGMTRADAILGSDFLLMTPLGMINGFAGKNSYTFERDDDIFDNVGSSYQDTSDLTLDASDVAGKKYGLVSSRQRKDANKLIMEALALQSRLKNISDETSETNLIKNTMGQENMENIYRTLRGGYDFNNTRVGKNGLKIERARKTLSKLLEGNKIKPVKEKKEYTPVWNDEGLFKITYKFEPEDNEINSKPSYEEWILNVDTNYINDNYDLELAYKYAPFEELEAWRLNPKKNHLRTSYKDENGIYHFAKRPNHPTIWMEERWFNDGINVMQDENDNITEAPLKDDELEDWQNFKNNYDLVKPEDGSSWLYVPKNTEKFAEGGKMNVIPEGALHARLHHMDVDGITKKGIPVVSEEGGKLVLLAEIERNEITFTLEVTKKIEELMKKGDNESAIEAGKLLAKEIIENTEDRTGLINEIQ